MKEGDQESPEKEAIKVFKESLHTKLEENEIEIAHRGGSVSPILKKIPNDSIYSNKK